MKSRELNKLYQMMRVSRFYYKHKSLLSGTPPAKRVVKLYNEKLDSLLVYALKQKEDIKYGAKEKNDVREEFTQALLVAGNLTGLYLLDVKNVIDLYQVDYSYTDLKALRKHDFRSTSANMINVIETHSKEIKEYGVKEKDIEKLRELLKKFDARIVLPRYLLNIRKGFTRQVSEHLQELNQLQRERLDKIAGSLIESQTVKSEYRKARRYIRHRHPQGMFDEMLKWYMGGKRGQSSKQKIEKIARYKVKDAALKIAYIHGEQSLTG